jgi:hypothetical protein
VFMPLIVSTPCGFFVDKCKHLVHHGR